MSGLRMTSMLWVHRHLPMSLALAAVLAGLTTTALAAQPATPGDPGGMKLSRDLHGLDPGSKIDVIVQFVDRPGEEDFEQVTRSGAKLKHELHGIKAGLFSLPVNALPGLARNPRIRFVSPDRPLEGSMDLVTAAANADAAALYTVKRQPLDGTGIAVAVLDSGMYAGHDDFMGTSRKLPLPSRIVYTENFTDSYYIHTDRYGHGTHVAGVIAGNGKLSENLTRHFVGVAPGASLVNLKVLDDSGRGTDSAVIQGILRAIELKSEFNIRVLNLSLGRPVLESFELDPLCQAVEAAWKAGIVVVVSAGNKGRDDSFGTAGYGTVNSPGNDPYVITVGAMKTKTTPARSDDAITSYSSKGPTLIDHVVKPDIVAPGNRVIATAVWSGSFLYENHPVTWVACPEVSDSCTSGASHTYYRLNGTSVAAPVVSGAATLLLQKEPRLTPDQVKAHLMRTASKAFPAVSLASDPETDRIYSSRHDIFTVGAGYLDIAAALADEEFAPAGSRALSPVAFYDAATDEVRLLTDSASLWGESVIWGDAVIWGDSIVWGDAVIWGDSIVWGDTSPYADSIVWGDTLEANSVLVLGED